MLATSVDVEALRYLRSKSEVGADVIRQIKDHISVGYQSQLTYQHQEGHFSAFAGPEGSLWLTAFCLSIFSQARELVTIDEAVLGNAARWIAAQQRSDGGWKPVGWVIHKELEGGLTGDYALTAFVALALAEYEPGGFALERTRRYLEDRLAGVDNAHSLAMGAHALAVLGSPEAARALDRLQALAERDAEGRLHWDPVPMEATSHAVLALYQAGRNLPASAGASWIAARKNSLGGFGNTQDTVMALKALVRDALAASASTDLTLRIERSGEVIQTFRVDKSTFDVVQGLELEPGPDLTVTAAGSGPAVLQLAKRHHLPAEALRSRGGLALDVSYASARIAVGESVRAQATLRFTGAGEKTNMTLAEIGVPTGLKADAAALRALVGQNSIQRVDVERRKVIVYLDRVQNGETISIPLAFTAAFAAQPAPVPSKAYDYYDPSIEALDEGAWLAIGPRSGEVAFLRGDASADGAVDLTDAVRTLEHLFLGARPIACADAADANDDGGVDIGDPVTLLFYLYAGGTPPAPPFPRPGEDRTADGLRCDLE